MHVRVIQVYLEWFRTTYNYRFEENRKKNKWKCDRIERQRKIREKKTFTIWMAKAQARLCVNTIKANEVNYTLISSYFYWTRKSISMNLLLTCYILYLRLPVCKQLQLACCFFIHFMFYLFYPISFSIFFSLFVCAHKCLLQIQPKSSLFAKRFHLKSK